jgi:superfamily I DNA/RNA helicase
MYTHASLTKEHGLLDRRHLARGTDQDRSGQAHYLVALLRRGVKLTGKGPDQALHDPRRQRRGSGQRLLITDLSTKFAKEYERNSDDINRLFYVGVTRAKKSLHLVLPKDQQKGFQSSLI